MYHPAHVVSIEASIAVKSHPSVKRDLVPAWQVPPRPQTVGLIAAAIKDSRFVCVEGPHGVGKTNHSVAAVESVSARLAVAVVGPTSEASPRKLIDQLRGAHGTDTIIVVDKPDRLDAAVMKLLAEVVLEGDATLVVETTGFADLPDGLRDLARQVRRTTVPVSTLTQSEFHVELVRYLGGPIPTDTSQFFWRATGGNQELAALAVTALRQRGDLALGKYAWAWTGPLEAPLAVKNHVERQMDALTATQQFFVERVALVGSVPQVQASDLIDDDSLEFLGRAGFVTTQVRNDGVAVVQAAAPLFAWVVDRATPPGRRKDVFSAVPVPERHREDAQAIINWTLNAMREGQDLTTDQIELANESAFTTLSFALIERFVDLVVPVNKPADDVIQRAMALSLEDRSTYVLTILQRALAYFFLDMYGRAKSDLKIGRAIVDQNPVELLPMLYQILMLEALVRRVTGDQEGLDAVYRSEIERAQSLGLDQLVVHCELQMLRQYGRDLMSRPPLEESLEVLTKQLDREAHAVALVPPVAFRLAASGRFRDSYDLFNEALARRELRITNLPESDHALTYAALVVKRAQTYLMRGDVEAGLALLKEPIAATIVDPGISQVMTGFGQIALGEWEPALDSLRAALQRFEERDHNRSAKVALAGYVQVLAHLGQAPEALAALKEYREMSFHDNAVIESDLEYRVLAAEYALGLPELVEHLDEFIARCTFAREWFGVLRGAHLGVVATGQPRYLELVVESARYVDDDVAQPFVADAEAVVAGDSASMIGSRAALMELGVWIPAAQAPLVLSKRQREISELVMAGLTNREIAERLHLSVRTVESHVAAVLMKAGASDRRHLARKLASLL